MRFGRSKILCVFVLLGTVLFCGGRCASGNLPAAGTVNTSKGVKEIIGSVSLSREAGIRQGDEVLVRYTLAAGDADSVVLFMNGVRVAAPDTSGYCYKLSEDHPTGTVMCRVEGYSGGDKHSRSVGFTVYAENTPVIYGHEVIKTYPHSADAYTQGLLYHDGALYESTGLEDKSSIRKVELKTGRVLQQVNMGNEYFGEGLALHDGKLYQLTWKNNKAFVYDIQKFEYLDSFTYGGEGWGITGDGKVLYMSDGTEKIHVLDPETFRRIRSVSVYTDNSKVMYLNELEWIDGELWANVYTSDYIVRIDPESGAVKGIIDMAGLLKAGDITPATDVLNGIAYDKKERRIFVTGKNWPKLFEVEIFRKP